MSERIRVNVRTLANTKAVKREKRNGRDVVIVPSATLPDNVVMNGIMYPADEIEKSYKTLNRAPAPLGHPLINNQFVSARDPEGINIGWVGAWNENVRRENGRVFLDKVIDVEVANRTEGGKAIMNAIEKAEPVHTSTGLYCNLEAANGDVDYKHIARDIEFDHDAILLGEQGAATPEQGVGMFVNAQGENEKITVINSVLEDAERDLEWAADMAVRAVDRMERASMIDRIVSAIKSAVGAGEGGETPATNRKDAEMADDKQLDELSQRVNALSETSVTKKDLTNALTEALKPLIDAQAEMKANQEAKDEAEKADLVNKIVKANLLDEADAKELTLNAARALAKKAEPGKAAPLNGAFTGNTSDDEWKGYSLNSHLDQKEAS